MSASTADMKGDVKATKKPFVSTIKISDIPPWLIRAGTMACAFALLGLSLYQGYGYAQVTTEPGQDRIMYTVGILAFILLAHGSVHMIVLAWSTDRKWIIPLPLILLIWGSIISIFTSAFMYNQQSFDAIAKQNQDDPIYQASMKLFSQSSDLVDQRNQLAGGLTNKVNEAPGTYQTQSRQTGALSSRQLDKAGNDLETARASLAIAANANSSTIDQSNKAMAEVTGLSPTAWTAWRATGQTVAELIVTFFWALIIGNRVINLVPVTSEDRKGKK